jgi:hypothetical protein
MKKPNIIPPTHLRTALPADVRAKLDLYLYSEAEGRVPHGAYSRFLAERITEFFAQKRKYLTEDERMVMLRVLKHCLDNLPQEFWTQAEYHIARELSEKL